MIQASQNDFEEFGVDQSTLDEMKQVRGELPQRAPVFLSLLQPSAPFLCRTRAHFSSRVTIVVNRHRYRSADGGAWQPGGSLGLAESGAELPGGLARSGGALSIWDALYSPRAGTRRRQAPAILAPTGIATSHDALRRCLYILFCTVFLSR